MLFDEFAASFENADIILLHKIYSSAREVYDGSVTGFALYEKTCETLGRTPCKNIFYAEECEDAFDLMKGELRRRDLFMTMGAGDNWKLGKKLFDYFKQQEGDK
jgi:UDP-N-acetylmuramate--alanine ligase